MFWSSSIWEIFVYKTFRCKVTIVEFISRSSSKQFRNYGLMKISEIIISIKRNVLDWQWNKKKIDAFEIVNSWKHLMPSSLYSGGILVLLSLNILSPSSSGINNNYLFLFCLKDINCNILVVFFYSFKKYFLIFLALI